VTKLFTFQGLDRVEVPEALAGDIVALSGLEGVDIGQTLTHPEHRERLRGIKVEEPTLSVDFTVNNSPFAGLVGKFVTTRQVRERLFRELERNVALRVEDTEQPDTFQVSGRGSSTSPSSWRPCAARGTSSRSPAPGSSRRRGRGEPPRALRGGPGGRPRRRGGHGHGEAGAPSGRAPGHASRRPGHHPARFRIPARGLFGYRSEFLTDTRGEGILNHHFLEYGPWAGPIQGRKKGVLVADRQGESVAYSLFNLQERATMFIGAGVPSTPG
jgi:GTP-binding protein